MAFENTAHDPLARAKLVAVDNGKINDKEKQVRRRACESANPHRTPPNRDLISLLQFPLQNRGGWHPKNLRFWRALLHPYFATKSKTMGW